MSLWVGGALSALGLIEHCRLSGIHIYESKMAWALFEQIISQAALAAAAAAFLHIKSVVGIFCHCANVCGVCVCVSVQSEHVVRHVKWSILSMNAWLCDVADADAHFASVFAIYLKVLMLFSFLESTCRTVCLHHEPLPKISHIPAVTHFVATFSTAIWFRLCYKFGFSPPCSCIHIKMLFCFYHFNSSRNCCFVFEMLIHVCTLNFSCC